MPGMIRQAGSHLCHAGAGASRLLPSLVFGQGEISSVLQEHGGAAALLGMELVWHGMAG